jgi:hypothetical protein
MIKKRANTHSESFVPSLPTAPEYQEVRWEMAIRSLGRCHLSIINLQINQLRRTDGLTKKVIQGNTASSVVD